MAVAKMKLVNIVGRLKNFDEIVQNCCIKGNFHPEPSTLAVEKVQEFTLIDDENPYERIMQTAVDIGVHSDISLRYSDFSGLNMSVEKLSEYISRAEGEIGNLNGTVSGLSQTAARQEQVLKSLSHLSDFNISLGELFGCKNIIFRFGRLPKDSYYKISSDDEYDNRLFFPLEEDELFFWGFYVAKKDEIEESDEFYSSLYFERINIIEGVSGTPVEAQASVTSELKNTYIQLDAARSAVLKYWSENEDRYLKIYSKIRYLHDSFDIRKYASKYGDSFYIFGWVTEHEVEDFTSQFDRFSGVDCIVETTQEAENITPPTTLINSKAVKPFEELLSMYGLPSYNEIDPTPFMAFTYAIMFGIMFGDLGQGLVLFLAAIFMKYKKISLGDILLRISIFSMVFGTLYNSIFGYEGLLPFTILPVHQDAYVITVLMVAIGLGMFLILACMIFNIINGVRQHNIEKYLFSQNGLAGFIFYGSLITSLLLLLLFNKNIITPVFIILLILIPVILIALKEPLSKLCERKKDWFPQNMGEFFLMTFFEMFEILLSFITNTISYIRVGAFIISHAALMIAVFTVAQLTGYGSPLVIVLGNIGVIILEGFIVAIQVLRLHFYEMFSRFYTGDGKPYEPVRIKYES